MMDTLVWDGQEFEVIDHDEAKRLEAENRVQIIDGLVDGLSLKYPHEFARDDAPEPEPEPEPEPLKSEKSEEPDPMQKAVQRTPMKDWRTYKAIVGEAIGKPGNRVTKADVESWLEENET